jgi:hypothetical protein
MEAKRPQIPKNTPSKRSGVEVSKYLILNYLTER